MSKERQIEEMIETLKKCSCVYTDCEQECSQCSNEELYDDALNHIARTLYNAGYRKQSEGEWIDTGDEELDKIYSGYKCSACGFIICGYSGKYCPNCGAKMKGGE